MYFVQNALFVTLILSSTSRKQVKHSRAGGRILLKKRNPSRAARFAFGLPIAVCTPLIYTTSRRKCINLLKSIILIPNYVSSSQSTNFNITFTAKISKTTYLKRSNVVTALIVGVHLSTLARLAETSLNVWKNIKTVTPWKYAAISIQ